MISNSKERALDIELQQVGRLKLEGEKNQSAGTLGISLAAGDMSAAKLVVGGGVVYDDINSVWTWESQLPQKEQS